MSAWRISIWCWVIFGVAMVGLAPALLSKNVALIVGEQVVGWAAFVYAMYLSQVVIRGGDKRLSKGGTAGTAKVLTADRTNTIIQQGEFAWEAPYVWKYQLEVTISDRSPYKTTLWICASLSVGETVPIRASKLNRKRVTIDREAYNQQYQARAGQIAAAGVGSGGPAVMGGPTVMGADQLATILKQAAAARSPQVDTADELAKLADLKSKGILTEAEFDAQKAKLLGE